MGVLSMGYFVAFVIGVPAGALAASHFGWQWVFGCLSGAAAVMFVIAIAGLPRDTVRAQRLDDGVDFIGDEDEVAGHGSEDDRISRVSELDEDAAVGCPVVHRLEGAAANFFANAEFPFDSSSVLNSLAALSKRRYFMHARPTTRSVSCVRREASRMKTSWSS